MDEKIVHQIVDEILTSLEPLETQSAAILQFLKAKGLATDADLAPFLEQAGNTANIRWRAVRVRTAALITNAMKSSEQPEPAPPKKDQTAEPEGSPERPQKEEGPKTKEEAAQDKPKAQEGTKHEGEKKENRDQKAAQQQNLKSAPDPSQKSELTSPSEATGQSTNTKADKPVNEEASSESKPAPDASKPVAKEESKEKVA